METKTIVYDLDTSGGLMEVSSGMCQMSLAIMALWADHTKHKLFCGLITQSTSCVVYTSIMHLPSTRLSLSIKLGTHGHFFMLSFCSCVFATVHVYGFIMIFQQLCTNIRNSDCQDARR